MIIDQLYSRHEELRRYLQSQGQLSYLNQVDEEFRRTFVLAIASYFEDIMQEIIQTYVKTTTNGSLELLSLVNIRFIKRQYHSWFEWDGKNVNKFWSFFGHDFKESRVKEISEDKNLEDSMKNFIELGDLRNRIVHQNFATFVVDLTVDDIYNKYTSAFKFVDHCRGIFS